jgi:cellobiose-specific phosphotransferase system component IIB
MVAKVTIPKGIARVLNYNEQKIKTGKAECIYAHQFLKNAEHLHFYEKKNRFENLMMLNKRATTNAIHISLNFSPEEKPDKDKLIDIAVDYMQKIGFDKQPYLVYQHLDAGHPHIHIVATNIQKDGTRISLHNIGRNQSEQARKEIEIEYGLVKANRTSQKMKQASALVLAPRVAYGKSETKRSITNVLDEVISQYKFTSLPELNAVLKLYNVCADRGKEQGIIYKTRGLTYSVLDEKGNKIGVPIKASSIYNKPTLNNLEKKFEQNKEVRKQFDKRIRKAIEWSFLQKPNQTLKELVRALEKERISTVLGQNKQGIIYGITYVDHHTKCVFNGSDLGKQYSAAGIQQRCLQQSVRQDEHEGLRQSSQQDRGWEHKQSAEFNTGLLETLANAIGPTEDKNYVPNQLKNQKKRRRRLSNRL